MLSARTRAANTTVFVVDDSSEMRRYLRLLLELDCYHVETACDGSEALRRLDEGFMPNVVLLDLQMPRLNGFRTLRRMRRLYPGLKVIICSAEDDPRKLRLAAALGADGHLSKPVQHLYLSAILERCLDGDSEPLPNPPATVITLPAPATQDS